MPATQNFAGNSNLRPTMENIIVGLIALGLLVYLFVAMIKPEKF